MVPMCWMPLQVTAMAGTGVVLGEVFTLPGCGAECAAMPQLQLNGLDFCVGLRNAMQHPTDASRVHTLRPVLPAMEIAGNVAYALSSSAPGQANAAPYLPSGEPQAMAAYDPAAVREPAPAKSSAGKPAKGSSAGGTKGGTKAGGTSGGSAVPTPATTSSASGPVGQVVGEVTGVVGGVVGGLTGSTPSSTTSSSPSPTSTTTPALPLKVNPTNGKCPDGYDPVLGALGITILCTLHQP